MNNFNNMNNYTNYMGGYNNNNNNEYKDIPQLKNVSWQQKSDYKVKKLDFGDKIELQVVSVVVTICDGNSYDALFESVHQKPPTGRVAVYSVAPDSLNDVYKAIKDKESDDEIIQELLKDMNSLSPDCIVFNWECCSGCSFESFSSDITFDLVKYLLDQGTMVMFGDFSAKALIKTWDSKKLGPNPFKKLGETNDSIQLNFNSKSLSECPSKQLEMVGKLCESGECVIHALGGTIVFGVDWKNVDNDQYDLEILTIATSTLVDSENLCEIKDVKRKGTVGHAMVKYKSGGLMLVSAGHWIELSHLNVNEDSMEKVSKEFGALYVNEFENIKKSNVSQEMKQQQYNAMASNWVQRNAPTNYMNFK